MLVLVFLLLLSGTRDLSAAAAGRTLRIRGGSVHCTNRGKLTLQAADGAAAEFAIFLWRDNWQYRRLDRTAQGVTVKQDGDEQFNLAGIWGGASGETPCLRFSLALQAERKAITLQLTQGAITAARLTDGIWAELRLPRAAFIHQRYLQAVPGSNGLVGRRINEWTRELRLETGGRLLVLSFDTPVRVKSRTEADACLVQIQLYAGNEPAATRSSIHFQFLPKPAAPPVKETAKSLAIRGVRLLTPRPQIGTPAEIQVMVEGVNGNPFDPAAVALTVEASTESGRTYRQPGFFSRPYPVIQLAGDHETRGPPGKGEWLVRIPLFEPGELEGRVILRTPQKTVTSPLPRIRVRAGDEAGLAFLRRDAKTPYLLDARNRTFISVGCNIPVFQPGEDPEPLLTRLHNAGINTVRTWMSADGFGLEWLDRPGAYRLETAARLDRLVKVANRLGIRLILCLDTHQDFQPDQWPGNPYNRLNGGPVDTPAKWFTDAGARRFYRYRLRYLVARWGAYPAVLAWELGNEFEGWPDAVLADVLKWQTEMSGELHRLDPAQHPVTVSWWSGSGPAASWDIPSLDLAQIHWYMNSSRLSTTAAVRRLCLELAGKSKKPQVFGEFSLRSDTPPQNDPTGWALHNSFWSAVHSGSAGIAMPWWMTTYVLPRNLDFHFRSMSEYLKAANFSRGGWQPITGIQLRDVDGKAISRDLVVLPRIQFQRAAENQFDLGPDGSIFPESGPIEYLHGSDNAGQRNPPEFQAVWPEPGSFTLHVGRCSKLAVIRILVDGKLKLERRFPAGAGLTNFGSLYRQDFKIWQTDYDQNLTVKIPSGLHRVKVENTGLDWCRVARYVFSGVAESRVLLVCGLRNADTAMIWLHNPANTWEARKAGTVVPAPAVTVRVEPFPPGRWELSWRDTWKGGELRRETVWSNGTLELKPGPISRDIAVIARKRTK